MSFGMLTCRPLFVLAYTGAMLLQIFPAATRETRMNLRSIAALAVIAWLPAGSACADIRDDIIAGAARCAQIRDNAQWLDCYYGAAQPMRSQLGLPPAPQAQIRLFTSTTPEILPHPSATQAAFDVRMAGFSFDRNGIFTATLQWPGLAAIVRRHYTDAIASNSLPDVLQPTGSRATMAQSDVSHAHHGPARQLQGRTHPVRPSARLPRGIRTRRLLANSPRRR